MTARVRWRDVGRWIAWLTASVCLATAALEYGGVDSTIWQYLAATIAVASIGCVLLRSRRLSPHPGVSLELWLITAIAAWMLLSLVPLPPALVRVLSPLRAQLALDARAITNADARAWLPWSIAPSATVERLLFVFPAMAIFVAAREMPLWWTGRRAWLAVAPVVSVAVLEALIGIAQLTGNPAETVRSVSGTYVNRNHYAGLLEMGLPLALTGAIAAWTGANGSWPRSRRGPRRGEHGLGAALRSGGLLLAATALLAGVVASLSRMGFAATLVAIVTVSIGWLLTARHRGRPSAWRWTIPLLLPLAIVLLVATNGMVLRFADASNSGDITADGRIQIWSETLRLIAAYPLTGAGLGTFEHALYPFRTAMSTSAVDYAHNDYLQILSELGIVGLALTLELAALIVWRTLRAASSREGHAWLAIGLLASLLALALHSVVDFNLYVPANGLALAWLAGVAVSPGLEREGI